MFFLCLMESQKFHDDENYSNKDYAKVSGVSPKELLKLELEFMELVNFKMFIKDDEYEAYSQRFEKLWSLQL